jgi:hypothetical protein
MATNVVLFSSTSLVHGRLSITRLRYQCALEEDEVSNNLRVEQRPDTPRTIRNIICTHGNVLAQPDQ